MNYLRDLILIILELSHKKSFFLFIALFLLLSSCKDQSTSPQKTYYPEPSEYRNSIFPLGTKNQWVYTDSTYAWYDNPERLITGASIYLSSINEYTGESNHGKWHYTTTDGVYNTFYVLYSVINDTVYVEDSWNNGALINPRIAFLPPSSIHDTAAISGPWPWSVTKVYASNRNLITPAGEFDSIYVYEVDVDSTFTYFRPRIGVICQERIAGGKVIEKSVLISYKLYK